MCIIKRSQNFPHKENCARDVFHEFNRKKSKNRQKTSLFMLTIQRTPASKFDSSKSRVLLFYKLKIDYSL